MPPASNQACSELAAPCDVSSLAKLAVSLTDLAGFCVFDLVKWGGGKKVHCKEILDTPHPSAQKEAKDVSFSTSFGRAKHGSESHLG